MEHNNFQHQASIQGDGSQYLGKRLLVGITYEDHDGELIRREQFHGLIVEAGEGEKHDAVICVLPFQRTLKIA